MKSIFTSIPTSCGLFQSHAGELNSPMLFLLYRQNPTLESILSSSPNVGIDGRDFLLASCTAIEEGICKRASSTSAMFLLILANSLSRAWRRNCRSSFPFCIGLENGSRCRFDFQGQRNMRGICLCS